MKFIYTILLLLLIHYQNFAQQPLARLTGIVKGTDGRPIAGANIVFLNTSLSTSSDAAGRFKIAAPAGSYTLQATYIGRKPVTGQITLPRADTLSLVMDDSVAELSQVTVSTGYQELPKERATGSFAKADRALLERSNSTDIIERLRDVVPGLSFNSVGTRISVRGQSTLFSNADPLIVVDGFPYTQPIENINPNDVESITVLKDAAAASIWGSRAGNGVIVITTKRGAFNKAPVISFNANVTVGQRPDLFLVPRMSSADYIDIEQRLFNQNYFKSQETDISHAPLSPVVELLIAKRDGSISPADADARIAALRSLDVRNDQSRYLYRQSIKQQYNFSLDGGSAQHRYYFSAGYDKNLDNQVGNGYDRLTLNANNTWKMGRRLELTAGVNLIQSITSNNNPGALTWNRGNQIYPYAQLADAAGNALPYTKDLRSGFLTTATNAGLLDWQYRPLDELRLSDNASKILDARLNTGLKYRLGQFITGLEAQLLYQYDHSLNTVRNEQSQETFFTRNLINRYTQTTSAGVLNRPVPLGGIVDLGTGNSQYHDLRGQLNYDHTFGERHAVSAIAGYEIQSLHNLLDRNRGYGYDPLRATFKQVDGIGNYFFYDNPLSSNQIPQNLGETDLTDHYRSYYANAAYTYDSRYTLSGSVRLDQSNLFGVRANQKGVPLYSAGMGWDISREPFYGLSWLSYLKLRATYGYNGNVNKSLSAFTTASYFNGNDSPTALPYAAIVNPPNPELRWERVQNINLGLDFAAFSGRLSGTLEYYWKRGIDLIGQTAFPPSSGISVFTGNTANTRGHGMDFSLAGKIIVGKLNWNADFFASYVTDKVTGYQAVSPAAYYLSSGNLGQYPLEGRPLFSVYSYAWAGLDPQTGDPRGYLNGQVSKDFNAIATAATAANLVYNGPSRPVLFGALRNTFNYRGISLSANIAYKLGYYFRRSSVRYGIDGGLSQQSGDYALRWQKPGDELSTNVPAVPAASSLQRDDLYTYSSALVEKGDHVRLQDVRIAYTLDKSALAFLGNGNLQVYVYAANLGIIWRANHYHLDPDFPLTYAAPRTIAAGLRLTY